jgi:radical SAM-linked protein
MAQRLRITFGRHGGARYLSHLEMMRMWERALRRADWKLAYSQGFNPHPKLLFAAALPVGVAAESELLDVHLEEPRALESAVTELSQRMPPGLNVVGVAEVPVDAPPIQHTVQSAEYVALCPGGYRDALIVEIGRVLAAQSLPRGRQKEGKVVDYDLRPMIRSLGLEDDSSRALLRMILRTDAHGAGRADEVLRELGVDPADCSITRTRLLLADQ